MFSALALPLRRAAPLLTRDGRAFLTWLGCWLVLPNLPFLPISLMGGPPRGREIVVCGIVGLAVHRWSYPVRLTAYFGLMTYITVSFIAHMFNMAPDMIMSVIGLVFDMDLMASPEYIVGTALLLLSFVAAAVMLRFDTRFNGWKWAMAAAAVTVTCSVADLAAARGTMGSYTRIAPDGAPFQSATSESHLATLADGKANVMVILVEAMGEPRDPALRERMRGAAQEEIDHLAWTEARLAELGDRPSLLNPLWYGGAFLIGLAAGRLGDRVSLGFVVETERQVERHLAGHLARLPAGDAASRAIVEQMKRDEAAHADAALAAGGIELPAPVRAAMRAAAKVMTTTAHRL